MAKAASSAVSRAKNAVTKDPIGTAATVGLGVATGGGSILLDEALRGTGNNTIGEWLDDPTGSKAAARQQDERYADALKAIDGKMLKSNSTTDSSSSTKNKSQSVTKNKTSTASDTKNKQVSTTKFKPKTAIEKRLDRDQFDAYKKQQELVDRQEQGILARQGVQDQARDRLGSVLQGDAFDLTDSETARINRLRDADISASSDAVNNLLNERLAEVEADAASRGVRGQAFSQLQGDAIGEAARNLNTATLDANRTAAQNSLQMPGQRVGIQAGIADSNSAFADTLQQQAIQNQTTLQDPTLKKQLMEERLAAATTTNVGSSSTTGSSTSKGTTNSSGTSDTTGTSTTAGEREVDPSGILAAQAGMPGEKAAGIAGNMNAINTAANVGGVVAAFSDEDLKTNKSPSRGEKRLQELLDAIGTSAYEYKDKDHGEGEYVGPMAQELEETALGEGLVSDTAEGKMVDTGRAGLTSLSASAMLNKRLDDLEKQLAGLSSPKKKKRKKG